MAKRQMSCANDNNSIEDWRFLALVFDRFLLFIFVAVSVIGTAVILLDTPYLWDKVDQQEFINKWHDMHLDLMNKPGYIPEWIWFPGEEKKIMDKNSDPGNSENSAHCPIDSQGVTEPPFEFFSEYWIIGQ